MTKDHTGKDRSYFEEMGSTMPEKRRVIVEGIASDPKVLAERMSLSCSEDSISGEVESHDSAAEKLEDDWRGFNDQKAIDATLGQLDVMQRRLSMRPVVPTTIEVISGHLGCRPDETIMVRDRFPRMMHDVVRYAVHKLHGDKSSPWSMGEVSAKIGKRQYSVDSSLKNLKMIRTGPDRIETVPVAPTVSLVNKSGEKAVLSVGSDQEGVVITYVGSGRSVIKNVSEWFSGQVKRFNYMKGAKLDGEGQFLNYEKASWADIVLAPGVREKIEANIVDAIKMAPVYRANGIPSKRGFVLMGETGTGKSMLAKILASTTECTFILVAPKSVHGAEMVSNIFDLAQALSPTILFFEDADLYLAERGSRESNGGILAEMMNRLDGVTPLEGVLTGISTNRPKVLEGALINRPGRFDLKIYMGPPDAQGRIFLLGKALSKVNFDPSEVVEVAADPAVASMKACDINDVCSRAIIKAIKSGRHDAHTHKASVSKRDLLDAAAEIARERALSGDYTGDPEPGLSSAQGVGIDDASVVEGVEEDGLGSDVLKESIDAEGVRDLMKVFLGDEFDLDEGDYEKKMKKIDGLKKAVETIFDDADMLRIMRKNGVRKKNIATALELLESDDTSMSDITIALTGDAR
jgi:hypothetical protein